MFFKSLCLPFKILEIFFLVYFGQKNACSKFLTRSQTFVDSTGPVSYMGLQYFPHCIATYGHLHNGRSRKNCDVEKIRPCQMDQNLPFYKAFWKKRPHQFLGKIKSQNLMRPFFPKGFIKIEILIHLTKKKSLRQKQPTLIFNKNAYTSIVFNVYLPMLPLYNRINMQLNETPHNFENIWPMHYGKTGEWVRLVKASYKINLPCFLQCALVDQVN